MNSSKKNMLLALMAGTAIGAGMGILYAPDSGSKTRGKIKSKTLETTHDLTEKLKNAKDDLTKVAQEKRLDFEEKLDGLITKASRKADGVILGLEEKLETLRKQNAKLQKTS